MYTHTGSHFVAEANLAKHGITFEEAGLIFRGITLTETDSKEDYREIRETSIGQLPEQIIIVLVHTDRNNITRIISARKANRMEKRKYDDYCKKITQ